MERGEVRWYAGSERGRRRPVLILTRSSALRYLDVVTVAPISTTIRDVPSEVVLDVADGLPVVSAANLHSLQTVPRERLGAWIATLSPSRLAEADRALQFALGIDPSSSLSLS